MERDRVKTTSTPVESGLYYHRLKAFFHDFSIFVLYAVGNYPVFGIIFGYIVKGGRGKR